MKTKLIALLFILAAAPVIAHLNPTPSTDEEKQKELDEFEGILDVDFEEIHTDREQGS